MLEKASKEEDEERVEESCMCSFVFVFAWVEQGKRPRKNFKQAKMISSNPLKKSMWFRNEQQQRQGNDSQSIKSKSKNNGSFHYSTFS